MAFRGVKRDLTAMLDSEDFTDFVIETNERPYKVHKVILCSQSDFFASACKGQFAESSSNSVTLHDDKPECVEAMIKHMYGGSIVDKNEDPTKDTMKCFRRYVALYIIADKYQLDALKEAAMEQVMKISDAFMHQETLMLLIDELLDETPEKLPWHCYQELGESLAETICKHAACLVHDSCFVEAYHTYPKLAPAIVDKLTEELEKEQSKMGNITAVYCNNTVCRGHRRRWTYKHGPKASGIRHCIWCGQTQLTESPA